MNYDLMMSNFKLNRVVILHPPRGIESCQCYELQTKPVVDLWPVLAVNIQRYPQQYYETRPHVPTFTMSRKSVREGYIDNCYNLQTGCPSHATSNFEVPKC